MSQLFPKHSPKLIQNVILVFFFALLIVLLQSTLPRQHSDSRGNIEVLLALQATVGLIVAFVVSSPHSRGASYEETGSASGMVAFYLIGNLYMCYATARGAYLAWRTANQAHSRARLSLRVAAAGLTTCCLGTHVPRVVSTSSRLALGTDLLPGTTAWTTPLLTIGIVAFFLGIGYPGVRTGIIKARLWIEARRNYRRLRPLWMAVYRVFPSIALFPPEHPLREALHLQHMRLRYYRRIIECRDGLVCLSPYIAEPDDTDTTPARLAELVRDVLILHSQGAKPVSAPSVIAAPSTSGMDADTQELLALSHALDRIAEKPFVPARG